jgi:hypothetical protein
MKTFYGAADTKINRKLRLLAACRMVLAEYGIFLATAVAFLILIGLNK